MREGGFLGVLAIDGSEIWTCQAELDPTSFAELSTTFVRLLKDLQGKSFRGRDLLVIDESESPCFLVFLSHPRDERVASAHDVAALAGRMQEVLTQQIARLGAAQGVWPTVAVGFGFRLHNPNLADSFQVRQVVGEARDSARRLLASDDRVNRKSALERIILARQVSSVFQPIVQLRDKSILGYEALSRGPAATEYESPLFLLRIADRTGLTVELDRVFRAISLSTAAKLPESSKIFINTLPSTVFDPELQPARLQRQLERLGIAPSRLVFEFSERYVVPNSDGLLAALAPHREMGIEVAIDDVGAGYSGLERIASLDPDYLKIDASLVRHAQDRNVTRSVLQALVRMGADIGAELIAEGIERPEEQQAIEDLGIALGQGFHLGRPAPWPE
jgi:EAL domain-containing protein (putative c-di-GMP-specific phosphodiesterase class I)